MGQAVKRITHFFMDSLTIKLMTVILFFFLIFPALKPVMDDFVKIILIWGGIIFTYDLFTKRTFLQAKNIGWLLIFIIMEAVTIAINHNVGLKNNTSLMCYTAVAMFVLYPNEESKNKQKLIRELRSIGMVYIMLCAAASLISLIIFAIDYNDVLVYANTVYYTGVFEGRLWGIYSNPNFPAAMIAAAFSFMLFPICQKATINKKSLPFQYTVLIVCFVLNFWYMLLAQSRGSIIAFLVFMLVYIFFFFRKKVFFNLRRTGISIMLSILSSVCVVSIISFSIPVIVSVSKILPNTFSRVQANTNRSIESKIEFLEETIEIDDDPEIGRDVQLEQSNMLTGRSVIWKQGWSKFLQKPLFGYGNVGSTKGITLHNSPDEKPVKHLHNAVMQSLVSNGLAGTIPLMIFALLSLIAMVRYIYRHRMDTWENSSILYGCFAFIALYMVNNTIEVFVVYSVSIPNFLFWIVMGYLMTLLSKEQSDSKMEQLLKKFSKPTVHTGDKLI